MEYQKIKIVIDKEGFVIIEIDGIKGKKCESLTNDLLAKLGTLKSQDNKLDYYEEPKDNDNVLTNKL